MHDDELLPLPINTSERKRVVPRIPESLKVFI